jgi:hypothetical protein
MFAITGPFLVLSIFHWQLSWIATMAFWAGSIPVAVREVRTRHERADVEVVSSRLIIRYPAVFRGPVEIGVDQLHSIVPLWLRPPVPRTASLWRRIDSRLIPIGVRASVHVPVVGIVDRKVHSPALGLVFNEERVFPEARARWTWPYPVLRRGVPIRALLLAVQDLEDAQRPFLGLGKLAELSPEAFEWLAPRSKATSPSSAPVP